MKSYFNNIKGGITLNIFFWSSYILSIFYASLLILAGLTQYKKKIIPSYSAISIIISGITLLVSSILIFFIPHMIFLIILSLFTVHILTIRNGYYLYGKIHIHHHLIRGSITFIIILFYII